MVMDREEKAFKLQLEHAREQLKEMERLCPHLIIATGTGQGARCEICLLTTMALGGCGEISMNTNIQCLKKR